MQKIAPNDSVITVVIPTYRRPKLLRRAVASVMNQTYPHLKICIYDNCSEDATRDVVEELMSKDPRIHYHCHSKNIGSIENFKFGIAAVNTPFFSLLSDDDLLLPTCYETLMSPLKNHPEVQLSLGNVIHLNEAHQVVNLPYRHKDENTLYPPGLATLELFHENFPFWTGGIFRKSVIDDVGNLNSDITLCDLDYLSRITLKCACHITTRPCAAFFNNPQGSSYYLKASDFFTTYSSLFHTFVELPEKKHPLKSQLLAALTHNAFNIWKLKMVNSIQYKDFDNLKSYLTPPKDWPFKPSVKMSLFLKLGRLCLKSSLTTQCVRLAAKVRKKALQRYNKAKLANLLKQIPI